MAAHAADPLPRQYSDFVAGTDYPRRQNRQVRRMTAKVGHPTLRLIRARIGDFSLAGLAPGQWRVAGEQEVSKVLPVAAGKPLRPKMTSARKERPTPSFGRAGKARNPRAR